MRVCVCMFVCLFSGELLTFTSRTMNSFVHMLELHLVVVYPQVRRLDGGRRRGLLVSAGHHRAVQINTKRISLATSPIRARGSASEHLGYRVPGVGRGAAAAAQRQRQRGGERQHGAGAARAGPQPRRRRARQPAALAALCTQRTRSTGSTVPLAKAGVTSTESNDGQRKMVMVFH